MANVNWRIGFGFDSHPFAQNRKLILGGIKIPYGKGLFGHSDADVLCHSITDALLGACGLKDIGNYFPDTNLEYKNIKSVNILAKVVKLIEAKGFVVANVDTTLVLKKPKISPYVDKMKTNLAQILKVSKDCIGIKAKTTEALGWAKVKSGIASYAVVLIVKKKK